jgi:hypothetical protein
MRPLRVILASPLLVLVLGGATCGQQKVVVPQVVHVPVPVVVEVPPALTEDCHDEPARNKSTGEAVRLANLRRESLAECTDRMRRIRQLKR